MNIIFFGTPDFAVPALNSLVNFGYDVVAVVTQPEKPVGRKQVLSPPPVKVAAQKLGLKILQPPSLKIESLENLLKIENCKLKIDVGVVAAYGKIIPAKYLKVPKYGFVNIHPSLLPKYRGPSPIQTAILNGEKETGISIMVIDEEVDHGPTLAKREFSIFNFQFSNSKELEKELAEMGAKLLVETLPKYVSGEIKPQPQDHNKATFTKMFSREDGRINWDEPAEKIYNLIRALNPEPGTWSLWNGKVVNIKKSKLIDGKLEIETLQLEGKRETPFREFLNGHPDFDISQLN